MGRRNRRSVGGSVERRVGVKQSEMSEKTATSKSRDKRQNQSEQSAGNDALERVESMAGSLLSSPEEYCLPSSYNAQVMARVTKSLYDYAQRIVVQSVDGSSTPSGSSKSSEDDFFALDAYGKRNADRNNKSGATDAALLEVREAMDELLIDGFDAEQVWAELQMRNEPMTRFLMKQARVLSRDQDDGDGSRDDEGEDDESGREDEDDEVARMVRMLEDADPKSSSRGASNNANRSSPADTDKDRDGDDDEYDRHDDDDDHNDDDDDDDEEEEEEQEEDSDSVARQRESRRKKAKTAAHSKARSKSGITEDRFFNLDEMNAFADFDFQDPNSVGLNEDGDGIAGLYGDDDDEDDDDDDDDEDMYMANFDGRKAGYDDFFRPPSDDDDDDNDDDDDDDGDDDGQEDADQEDDEDDEFSRLLNKNKNQDMANAEDNDEEDEEEDDVDESTLSTAEREQRRVARQIRELEQKIVRKRDWDQIGEVSASKRPADSLLERHLDVEYAGKPPEPVTEETTAELEDIIRQRIIDEAWDDPVRLEEVEERPYKPTMEVSQEKSKLGLAEIYEKQYVDKVVGRDADADVQDELAAEHKEIAVMFANLCHKLDALSNFHFTPKPPAEEIQVQSTAPAIRMEEVVPMGVSSAKTTAPQEVFASSERTGDVTARAEMSREEKKSRRASRRRRRKHKLRDHEATEKKRMQAMPHMETQWQRDQMAKSILRDRKTKIAGRDAEVGKDTTHYNRSTAFFQKLDDARLAKQGAASGATAAAAAALAAAAGGKKSKGNRRGRFDDGNDNGKARSASSLKL